MAKSFCLLSLVPLLWKILSGACEHVIERPWNFKLPLLYPTTCFYPRSYHWPSKPFSFHLYQLITAHDEEWCILPHEVDRLFHPKPPLVMLTFTIVFQNHSEWRSDSVSIHSQLIAIFKGKLFINQELWGLPNHINQAIWPLVPLGQIIIED